MLSCVEMILHKSGNLLFIPVYVMLSSWDPLFTLGGPGIGIAAGDKYVRILFNVLSW